VIYTSQTLSTHEECNRSVFGISQSLAAEPLLPVHPWQLQNSEHVRSAIGIRLLPTGMYVRGVPLLSLRTFRLNHSGHHVKLPIDAVITSTRRLIYQMHCQNAVPIGALVASIQAVGALPSSFVVQRDIATFSIPDMELAPHVSVIVGSQTQSWQRCS